MAKKQHNHKIVQISWGSLDSVLCNVRHIKHYVHKATVGLERETGETGKHAFHNQIPEHLRKQEALMQL